MCQDLVLLLPVLFRMCDEIQRSEEFLMMAMWAEIDVWLHVNYVIHNQVHWLTKNPSWVATHVTHDKIAIPHLDSLSNL